MNVFWMIFIGAATLGVWSATETGRRHWRATGLRPWRYSACPTRWPPPGRPSLRGWSWCCSVRCQLMTHTVTSYVWTVCSCWSRRICWRRGRRLVGWNEVLEKRHWWSVCKYVWPNLCIGVITWYGDSYGAFLVYTLKDNFPNMTITVTINLRYSLLHHVLLTLL